MAAFVRVSGPANGNFLIGYPGISATMVSAHTTALLREVKFELPWRSTTWLTTPSYLASD